MSKQITQTVSKNVALEVKNFSKKYKRKGNNVVDNANFKVYAGEFHGFIGANGAGKTTTIKSLIGAYARFDGEINIFGHDNHSLEAKRKVGYIPELARFPKKLSTYQYVYLMANLAGIPLEEAKEFSKKTLNEVGLGPVMKKSPNDLSSGQKKKVLLAQALVGNPEILIMDEPAANLDPQARYDFFEELKRLKQEGKAIFISSHILSELGMYADSITILDGGKVVYTGPINGVEKAPEFEYVVSFKLIKDLEEMEKWIKAQKLEFEIVENNEIIVDFKNETNLLKANDYIVKNKLVIEKFSHNKLSLDQIYEKYVQYGSVETKGKDVRNRKKVSHA